MLRTFLPECKIINANKTKCKNVIRLIQKGNDLFGLEKNGKLKVLLAEKTVSDTCRSKPLSQDEIKKIESWDDIVAIDVDFNGNVFGLKNNGRIVYLIVDDNTYGRKVDILDEWEGIVDISVGHNHVVGVDADGKVYSIGKNEYGECNVCDWNDMAAVVSGTDFTVGVRKDGTVIAIGLDSDGHQSSFNDWKLFDDFETLEKEYRDRNERLISKNQNKLDSLNMELMNTKGIFARKKRLELKGKIDNLSKFIEDIKKRDES